MRTFFGLRQPGFVALWIWLLLLLAPRIGNACDVYNPADGTLTIAQVIAGNKVYTNVVAALVLADVRAVGAATANPAAATFDFYDVQTGLLTTPCVVVGGTTYSDVVTAVDRVVSVGGADNLPTAPTLWLRFPLQDAFVGEPYGTSVVRLTSPPALYTYAIDTLAAGALPPGMTLHFDGTVSGTPFATGATDVNGRQIAHTYTFGVCAIDTLSRLSTSPCPQASITVRPASITATIVGNGTVSPAPAGNSCGSYCVEGYSLGSSVTLTATPAAGSTFTGWSGACSGTGNCVLSVSGRMSVTATFAQGPALSGNWSGNWAWSGPAVNGCPANDGGTFTAALTQTGSSLTGSINADGVQLLQDGTCSVVSTSPSGGSISGTISGATVSYSFTLAGNSLAFSGTATLSGNTLQSVSLMRVTGGSGSFALTKQ